MSALGNSEGSAPQGFKCISIMGDVDSPTVRSRGGVLSRGGSVLGGSTVVVDDVGCC